MKAVIFLIIIVAIVWAPWLNADNSTQLVTARDSCLAIEEVNWVPFGRYVNTKLGCGDDPEKGLTYDPEKYERQYFVSFVKSVHEI